MGSYKDWSYCPSDDVCMITWISLCHEMKIRRKAEPKGIKRRSPRQEAKKKKGMKNGRVKDMRIRLQENIHHDLELLILLFLLRLLRLLPLALEEI